MNTTIRTNPKTPDACSYGYWSCCSPSEECSTRSSLFCYHHIKHLAADFQAAGTG